MASEVAPEQNPVSLARDAEARRAYEPAVQHWRRATEENPGNPNFARRLIAALEKCGRSEEAELAALEARCKFPADVGVALELGWIAARRKEWALALRRWQEVDAKLPDQAAMANVLGLALTHLGRLKEAEALLAAAQDKHKEDFGLALAYATFPAKEGRWPDAVERLEEVVHRFPGQPNGFAQLGNMLRMAARKEEAQRVLALASEKFPNAASIAIEAVKLIEPDWRTAAARWRSVTETHPDDPAAYAGYGKALRLAGDHAMAESILRTAKDRFPAHFQIACEYAHLAVDKADWDEAMRRWQRVVERFPEAEEPPQALARVRWSASFSNILASDTPEAEPAASPPSLRSDVSDDNIMGRFESLGENCEFGLVQRYHGLEPLGLLRFSSVHQTSLLDLLKTRFEGVGDPENTRLDIKGSEYLTSDRRYGMVGHTYVAPHSVDQKVFFKEQCKRIAFLRRKLLSDLEKSEKIFVVTAHESASDAAAVALYTALQEYGSNYTCERICLAWRPLLCDRSRTDWFSDILTDGAATLRPGAGTLLKQRG